MKQLTVKWTPKVNIYEDLVIPCSSIRVLPDGKLSCLNFDKEEVIVIHPEECMRVVIEPQ